MSKKTNKTIFFESLEDISSPLSGRYTTAWTEESFYFEKKTGRQIVTTPSKNYIGSHFTKKKSKILFFILLTIFILVFSKIFYLQIIKGSFYETLSEGNRQRIIPIPSERGLIYDTNDKILTQNIPKFALAIVPQDLPRNQSEKTKIIEKLSKLTEKTEAEIANILDEYQSYSYESIVIQDNISYDTALSILIASSDLPGIKIERGSRRLYINSNNETEFSSSTISTSTNSNSLAHIIGYIGKLNRTELDSLYSNGYLPSDSIGKTGLEKTYESFLRGTYGRRRIEVNASGKEQQTIAEEPPKPGYHLQLSIDTNIQNQLEKIINESLTINKKKKASGIVLNPNTGEIIALVSLPGFDNNDFSSGIDKEKYNKYLEDENNPLFNRAIGGTYPSGSTIKPAIAASALEEKIINESTSFLSNGGLQVSSWFFPDWQAGGHGITNVKKSLAWSVNTFYYYIGGGYGDFVGLGVEKITNYLRKFGFASLSGIDLPGEQAGFLPSKQWKEDTKGERWYVGDTYNLSIGQGDILVTPLQIANMTATIANGGKFFRPYIVKAVVDPITNEKQTIDPEIINNNFINKNNLKIVQAGMKDCVLYGSCRRLSLLNFSSAGKTGTAQWNTNKDNHAWFTAFAPYEKPEIVVTIMVEEGGEGSGVAAPIAYEFLRWWGTYTNHKP